MRNNLHHHRRFRAQINNNSHNLHHYRPSRAQNSPTLGKLPLHLSSVVSWSSSQKGQKRTRSMRNPSLSNREAAGPSPAPFLMIEAHFIQQTRVEGAQAFRSGCLEYVKSRRTDALLQVLNIADPDAMHMLFGVWSDLKKLVFDNPKAEAFEREYATYYRNKYRADNAGEKEPHSSSPSIKSLHNIFVQKHAACRTCRRMLMQTASACRDGHFLMHRRCERKSWQCRGRLARCRMMRRLM